MMLLLLTISCSYRLYTGGAIRPLQMFTIRGVDYQTENTTNEPNDQWQF